MNKIETKILNCSAVREAEKNMVFAARLKYLGILDDQLMEASREFYEKHSDLYGIKNLL